MANASTPRKVGDVVEVKTDRGWDRATVDRIEVRTWEPGSPRWLYVRLGYTQPYRLPSGRNVDTDLWTTPDTAEFVREPASP